MRLTTFVPLCIAVALLVSLPSSGAEPAPRYEIQPDLKTYPQSTPKDTLGSLIKALDNKKVDYLLAQLSDPEWVDAQVKKLDGKFARVVEEATTQLTPVALERFKRFQKLGKWTLKDDRAVATYKLLPSRVVRMKKIGGRWYLLNDYTP